MKPSSKRESWWQWHYRDGLRICVKSLKECRFNKKRMSKAKRATDKRAIEEGFNDFQP